MKHPFKDYSWRLRLYIGMAFFSFMVVTESEAQSIQRQSIGICGTNMADEGILVKQSIGQPYATSTYYSEGVGFRPGFQQPYSAAGQSSGQVKQKITAFLNLKVYPNPASNAAMLQTPETITNASLKVRDISGRLFVNEIVSELKSHTINCESWANGIYLVTVSDEKNTTYSSKLIISK